ncbi:unnamed protein product, partial [Owenia fusiformis]
AKMSPRGTLLAVLVALFVIGTALSAYAPCKRLCSSLKIADNCGPPCGVKKGMEINGTCWKECAKLVMAATDKLPELKGCITECSIPKVSTEPQKPKRVKGGKKSQYAPCKTKCKRLKMSKCASVCKIPKGKDINHLCWVECVDNAGSDIRNQLKACMTKCVVKKGVCPPASDPRYGGSPPTSCCVDQVFHTATVKNGYTCYHQSNASKVMAKKCKRFEVFRVTAVNICGCVKKDAPGPGPGPGPGPQTCGTAANPCCRWGMWSSWVDQPCSKSCNGGIIRKERRRIKLFGSTGNNVCLGQSSEVFTGVCNTQPCGGGTGGLSCRWSDWTAWQQGACSVTCGNGVRNQTRSRTKLYGAGNFGQCLGASVQTQQSQICYNNPCPNCQWGAWTQFVYGQCSKSCGGGTMSKSRTRTKVFGNFGGLTRCDGDSEEKQMLSCNSNACPEPPCQWGAWGQLIYTACSVT